MPLGSSTRKILLTASCVFIALLLVSASTTRADAVIVDTSQVKVASDGAVEARMEVVLVQNITSEVSDFRLPIVNTSLGPNNATEAFSLIMEALGSKSPGLQLDSASIRIATSDWDPLDAEQSTRMILDLRLHGVSKLDGSILLTDTAWRSFVVDRDINALGISVNRVGESYLTTAFQRIRDINRGSVTVGLIWYLEGRIDTPVNFLNAVPNATLLDFSGLREPIDNWDSSFDFSTVSTRWSMSSENYNLIVVKEETLPMGEKVRTAYGVRSLARMEVHAPGIARTQGDMISIEAGSGLAENLMLGLTGSLAVTMAAGFFIERRITARKPVRKRSR